MRYAWPVLMITIILLGAMSVSVQVLATAPSLTPSFTLNGEQVDDPIGAAYNTRAVTLRITLQRLLREHVVLTTYYLPFYYDGLDVARTQRLLSENSTDIADLLGDIYGTRTEDEFLRLWNQHIEQYKAYSIGRRHNNTQRMTLARGNLETNAGQIGALLDRASKSPDLTSEKVRSHMLDHVNGTLSFIDAHVKEDAAHKAILIKSGFDQAGIFADTLSRGIMQDKPDLF